MDSTEGKRRLVQVLQAAYSGELAAALAYAGHARSVRDEEERQAILAIRADELQHRERVGQVLAEIGAHPSPRRELLFRWIGRTIAALCRVGGWFLPMYGAGRLERGNIEEYEHAARYAQAAGFPDLVDELLTMAEVEWDHELYFRERIQGHRLSRILRTWPPPPPRSAIRDTFPAAAERARR